MYLCDDLAIGYQCLRLRATGESSPLVVALQATKDLVQRDSSSAPRWADLAGVFSQAASREEGRFCINRAVELGRSDISVLVGAGQFYLQNADIPRGLSYLSSESLREVA